MFGLFRRRASMKNTPKELVFKGTEAAFEYACKYSAPPIDSGAYLYGLVIGESSPSPTQKLLKIDCSNYRTVRLATEGGPVETPNCGHILDAPPSVGDLVSVTVGSYDPKYPVDHQMNYFVVVGIHAPVLEVETHTFKMLKAPSGITAG